MKVIEHYPSVQGEGPNVGELTQFLRFAGCNLRCPGWPCDTQFAIDPKLYKDKYVKASVGELLEDIYDLGEDTGARRVCFTGGEPLMQGPELFTLISQVRLQLGYTIDVFTNGTFAIPADFDHQSITVVMDWKLKGSGEGNNDMLSPRKGNALRALKKKDAIKYVIKDEADFQEALTWSVALKLNGLSAQEFCGVVWGEMPEAKLVDMMMEYGVPWRLNVQMHNHIWDPQERGR